MVVAPPVVTNSLKGDASDKDTNTLVGDYPIGGEMLDTIAPSWTDRALGGLKKPKSKI